VSTETIARPISRGDLKQFPTEVAARLIDITTNHGIVWRMPDGGHVLLYNGGRGRPYKVAAKRPAQSTMPYLDKWVEETIPGYFAAPASTTLLTAQLQLEDQEQQPEQEQAPATLDPTAPGQPLVYSTGKTSVCFVWNENDDHKYLQCTMCNHSQEGMRYAHLHEGKHTGTASANAAAAGTKAQERRALAAAERQAEKELAASAAELLAQYFGIATGANKDVVDRLNSLLVVRDQQVDDLTKERDDLLTKLSVIREAMSL